MSIDLKPGLLVLSNAAPEDVWLAARLAGIGASEIAAVAGLSRRRGPWDVWSSKVDGTEFEPTAEMRWGTWIERQIISWWAKETGREIGEAGLYRSAEHEWLLATPDALVLEPETYDHEYALPDGSGDVVTAEIWATAATVDAKNAAWYAAEEWDDGAPVDYLCQKTWQMLAVGVRRGYLVGAIGGKPPIEREITLDDELAGWLIEAGQQLWARVLDKTPPPLDGSASARTWINRRYPHGNPELEVALSDEDVATLRRLREVKASLKQLGQVKDGLENQIKNLLGDSIAGTYRGQTWVTWKELYRKGYEVKPTTYRQLRLTGDAEKGLE